MSLASPCGRQGSCGEESWSAETGLGALEAWSSIETLCRLDQSTKRDVWKNIWIYWIHSSYWFRDHRRHWNSLSTFQQSPNEHHQEITYANVFLSTALCFLSDCPGQKLELRIYTEGIICIVHHPAEYVSISVSQTEWTVRFFHSTNQINSPLLPVDFNVRSHCS